ncbi:hypothetical protein F0562_028558 [Nyssa sinensis]|uniref:Uncharacterized protein n=1 Tax=Nyssa sinensis TaxID=561372 RepID=A0A5J5B0M0_9ASTE|nr:hypothetical protein F0562_028558 [Nyssa sinensis]
MGLMLLMMKKISLLFLLISASLLPTSIAGRRSKYVNNLTKEMGAVHVEISEEQLHHGEVTTIYERVLRVNTKDYGKYDPAPALGKPPFKLIPN